MPEEIFTNEFVNIDVLPHYEEIPLRQPHRNYLKIIFFNITILFLIGSTAIGLGLAFIDDFKPHVLLVTSLYVSLIVIITIAYWFGFQKRGYAIRSKDVIYKSGIIAESTTIVPLNRIQHIELNEGIFSRIYKLGTLQLFTAGGQTGHLKISGIPIETAKSIRDLLLNKLELAEDSSTENKL